MPDAIEAIASPELVTEKSVADSWRLPVKDLATIRRAKLRRPFHWDIVHHTVHYTPDGVIRLKDFISQGIKEEDLKPRADPKEESVLVQKWKVIRVPPNPRMVLLENCWTGEAMYMYVRVNRFFKRGMTVQDSDMAPPDAMHRRRLIRRPPRTFGRW